MCTMRELEGRMHKEIATRQILGSAQPYASSRRGHGYSIEEGAEP
jgi:hypothetical protein